MTWSVRGSGYTSMRSVFHSRVVMKLPILTESFDKFFWSDVLHAFPMRRLISRGAKGKSPNLQGGLCLSGRTCPLRQLGLSLPESPNIEHRETIHVLEIVNIRSSAGGYPSSDTVIANSLMHKLIIDGSLWRKAELTMLEQSPTR